MNHTTAPKTDTTAAQTDQELAQAQAITAANESAPADTLTLQGGFVLHDVESHLSTRRRARGAMTTSSAPDFAAYTLAHKEPGASVFINADNMAAVAVLNLGTPEAPGHADNLAQLKPKRTAAYTALLSVANGTPLKQSQVAEFIEDWRDSIVCSHGDETVPTTQAIAAVRSITIEELRKMESTEQQLRFTCEPYAGFYSRQFDVRISVQAGDKPALVLRIIKQEWHNEDMANELAHQVRDVLHDSVPTLVGTYAALK
jgi:uncharacterized protein YfdQ (DUF2303 family)